MSPMKIERLGTLLYRISFWREKGKSPLPSNTLKGYPAYIFQVIYRFSVLYSSVLSFDCRVNADKRQKHKFCLPSRDLINFPLPSGNAREPNVYGFYHRWMVDFPPLLCLCIWFFSSQYSFEFLYVKASQAFFPHDGDERECKMVKHFSR